MPREIEEREPLHSSIKLVRKLNHSDRMLTPKEAANFLRVRVDNIEKAATGIPLGEFSILMSHTPEVYQQASYADFDLLLGGHTHGGQMIARIGSKHSGI